MKFRLACQRKGKRHMSCHLTVTGCEDRADLENLGVLHDHPAHGGFTVSAKRTLVLTFQ